MNKLYVVTLLLLLSNSGCFNVCGPQVDTKVYFRYINDELPPLEEIYIVTKQGPLLVDVYYDSDNDWIADKALYFSDNTENDVPTVKDMKGKFTKKYTTKAKIRDYFVYTPENMILETLIEPIDVNNINRKRFESLEYKKTIESILKMSPNPPSLAH